LRQPAEHVDFGEIASRTTVDPFDFLFFEGDTTTSTFDDFADLVGAVTVTRIDLFFAEYRSTVLRVLPLTRTIAFPPFGPALNHSVTDRPLIVWVTVAFAVDDCSTLPPIAPRNDDWVHCGARLATTCGVVVVVGGAVNGGAAATVVVVVVTTENDCDDTDALGPDALRETNVNT